MATSLESRVQVTVAPEAVDYIRAHGGVMYVWPTRRLYCCGSLTLLDTAPRAPGGRTFDGHVVDGVRLYLDASLRGPAEVRLEIVRFPRRHVRALWDGCVWVM